MKAPSCTQRGVGLIDALVALAILAFGLLGLTQFQGRLTAQATDAQLRASANRLANELVGVAMVDPANLACYSLPAAGACGNARSRAYTDDWKSRARAALPGSIDPTSEMVGTRMTVTLSWTAKDNQDARQLVVRTDVQ